jgi:uncharacterized protein YkwD
MRRNNEAPLLRTRYLGRAVAVAAASLILSTPLLHAPPAAEAAGCADAELMPSQTTIARFNAATICLLNQDRASSGLAPLAENAQLDSAALGHSSEMRQFSFFAHESPDGSPFQDRIVNTGYLFGASRWSIGENIAWGSWQLGTPQAIETAWMNSQHHRDNILDPDYREIGVGSVFGSPSDPNDAGAVIVTHDFGRADRGMSKAAKKRARRKAKRLKRKRMQKKMRSQK